MTFPQALKSGCVISLADSQMLKTIREVTNHQVDYGQLEFWITEKNRLKKSKTKNKDRKKQIYKTLQQLNTNIYNTMYIPEYISVVMDNKKHYAYIYANGFYFNGIHYSRFSCSASQARVSTVIFIRTDIKEKCKMKLDNGRDLTMPLAPSKYNAYFGLYSSAIKEVTTPRFCIVKDCEETRPVDVDFVTETDPKEDDYIEPRTINVKFNLFDGSGLISPEMAEQWGKDLSLDYTPCQFCVRWSFTKGMVNEFDFRAFCETEVPESEQEAWFDELYDNGLLEELENRTGKEYFCEDVRYLVTDVYDKLVDLRDIDVILSESQVKLWNAWKSQEDFERCCSENHIVFGVTRPSPKEDKKVLMTNYQFLQTLKMNDEDIEALCKDTIDYIQKVSLGSDTGHQMDIYYTLLFMLGENLSYDSVKAYLKSSDNYWLKSLFVDHSLIYDKYSKEKIRDCIVRRIEQACLGKILVPGNFQCIVPDNYAYMQWITRQKVVGLLKAGEGFCQFWNEQDVKKVDCMRSPLTHFSEHGIDSLVDNEFTKKWFKYSYSGYICNIHDAFTMVHAGSDFDFDILATTSAPQFINCAWPNQRVVTYDAPKPTKILFTEDDLYRLDTFSFGNDIGSTTNCGSVFIALLPLFDKDSKEYQTLWQRIKNICCAQSKVIDRTKIGKEVKTINTMWKTWQKITDEDTPEVAEKKKFENSILADRKPYFMIYKYPDLKKEFNTYKKEKEIICKREFGIGLSELLSIPDEDLTEQQRVFKFLFYKRLNIVDSPCEMNRLCHYIESVDFNIRQKVKTSQDFDCTVLMSDTAEFNDKTYASISRAIKSFLSEQEESRKLSRSKSGRSGVAFSNKVYNQKEMQMEYLKNQLSLACPNEEELTNYMVQYFYTEKKTSNKGILWSICGPQLFKNVRSKHHTIYFPEKTEDNRTGDLTFLYENYSIEEMDMVEIFGNDNEADITVFSNYSLENDEEISDD